MLYHQALKEWNNKKAHGMYCRPRKGTPEHAEVKAIQNKAKEAPKEAANIIKAAVKRTMTKQIQPAPAPAPPPAPKPKTRRQGALFKPPAPKPPPITKIEPQGKNETNKQFETRLKKESLNVPFADRLAFFIVQGDMQYSTAYRLMKEMEKGMRN